MGFSAAIQACFAKYATFQGRSPRSEYWYFILFQVIVDAVARALDSAIDGNVVTTIAAFALIIPVLAVSARRLHDIDRTSWWLLAGLIPLVGAILLLIWACQRGTPGANRFGPDPFAIPAYKATL